MWQQGDQSYVQIFVTFPFWHYLFENLKFFFTFPKTQFKIVFSITWTYIKECNPLNVFFSFVFCCSHDCTSICICTYLINSWYIHSKRLIIFYVSIIIERNMNSWSFKGYTSVISYYSGKIHKSYTRDYSLIIIHDHHIFQIPASSFKSKSQFLPFHLGFEFLILLVLYYSVLFYVLE